MPTKKIETSSDTVESIATEALKGQHVLLIIYEDVSPKLL